MKNSFIIWTIGVALFSAIQLKGQMQFEAPEDYGQIFDVVFHPVQQDLIYARTITNHIVKSENHGTDWEIIYSVPQENWYITIKDLKIINDGTSLSFIISAEGTAFNKVVIFDLESGSVTKEFFTPIGSEPGNLIQSYSIYPENDDILLLHTTKMVGFSLTTEVFYTINGGEAWQSVYFSPDHGNIHVNNVAIAPENSEKLFIMRGASPDPIEGGLLISNDSGQTWTEKIPGTNYSAITFNPANSNDIFLGSFYLGSGQQENLFRSNDGGETWEVVGIEWTSMSSNSIHSITFNPLDLNQIMVLEENEIVVSYDRGATWANYVYPTINSEDYYYGLTASFNPFVNNEVIISANYYPFISQDGGETLTKLRSPFVNSTGRLAVFNQEEKHVYYGMRGGYLHKDLVEETETPYGLIPIESLSPFSNSGVFADPNVAGRIYFSNTRTMTGVSSVFLSSQHGADPVNIYSSSYIMLLAADSFKPDPGIVLMSFGESMVKLNLSDLEDVDSEDIILPSFGYVVSLLFDSQDENTYFIAQADKIFKTVDNGQTWQQLTEGLESVTASDYVYDIKRNPLNNQEIATATSQGIFKSEDNGQNWVQIYSESPINRVEFSPFTEGKIIASAHYNDGGEFSFPASDTKTIYTKNNGETWEEIGTNELGFLRASATEIMFNGENSADVYFHVQDLGLVKYTLDLTTLGNNGFNNQISEVTIYPNPTTGILNFNSKSEIQNVVLFDLSGRKISEFNSSQINISSLPKGIYLVKISTKDGKTTTKKVVKK